MGRIVIQTWPRALGIAIIAASGVVLSGCVAPYGERVDAVSLAQDRMLGPEAAFIAPPIGGPAVIGVIERIYSNAVRQKIVLQTDGSVAGENTIEVTFFGPVRAPPIAGKLKRDTGTLVEIGAEMRRKIPVPMAISPDYAQNSYGPFGFALGGSAAGRCLYAWQVIRAQRNIFQEPSSRGEISLRVRLCRRGVSDAALLSMMYGFAIVATLPNRNWNPFGTPPPADPDIGRRGLSINPLAEEAARAPAAAVAAPARPATTRQQTSSAPATRRRAAPQAPSAGGRRAPGQLPTPVAEPSTVRSTAGQTLSPPLGMPPALNDAAPVDATPQPASSGVPAAPAVSTGAGGAAAPVRQIVPAAPSSGPAIAPASPIVPAATRVSP